MTVLNIKTIVNIFYHICNWKSSLFILINDFLLYTKAKISNLNVNMLTDFNKFEISDRATSENNGTQILKTGISQVTRKYLKHTFIGIKDRGGYPRLSIAGG